MRGSCGQVGQVMSTALNTDPSGVVDGEKAVGAQPDAVSDPVLCRYTREMLDLGQVEPRRIYRLVGHVRRFDLQEKVGRSGQSIGQVHINI